MEYILGILLLVLTSAYAGAREKLKQEQRKNRKLLRQQLRMEGQTEILRKSLMQLAADAEMARLAWVKADTERKAYEALYTEHARSFGWVQVN